LNLCAHAPARNIGRIVPTAKITAECRCWEERSCFVEECGRFISKTRGFHFVILIFLIYETNGAFTSKILPTDLLSFAFLNRGNKIKIYASAYESKIDVGTGAVVTFRA
jgi:hypothetical protein